MADNNLRGRSRLGIPPEIRDILNLIEQPDQTTGLDLAGNLVLKADDRYIALGADADSDSKIFYHATNGLSFFCAIEGNTRSLSDLMATASTLDAAFDGGNAIDGAQPNAAAGVQIGDGTNYISIYEGGDTHSYLESSVGNIVFKSASGTISCDDDNLVTTGKMTADGGFELGADNVKLTIGAGDDADAYFQWDSANLDIYSAAAIDFLTGADTDDYMTLTTTAHVPTIGTTGSCDLNITSSSGEIGFADENLTTTGNMTATSFIGGTLTVAAGSITDSSGAISFGNENLTTQGTINIAADSVNLTIGASGATDAYLNFDGAGNLVLYDTNTGAVNLVDLAGGSLTNPDVTGDLTITNGQFIWTDSTDEVAATWTFAGVANDSIDIIASSTTTANIIHVVSTSLTSGTGILVDLDESVVNGGYYFRAYDSNGTATVFSVAEDGVTTIAGKSGDALVITLGGIQITDGDIDMDEGKITIDTTVDETSYIKRNQAITTGPVLEIEETSGDADNPCLLIDHNPTGDVNACEVTYVGTGFGVSITTAANASGGYEALMVGAGASTAAAFYADGSSGTAWIGGAGVGLFTAVADGAIANGDASLVHLSFNGTPPGTNITGICINAKDNGAATGTSYAMNLQSNNNNGLKIQTKAAATTNLTTICGTTAAQTSPSVKIDGSTGNGFVGAAATGLITVVCDKVLANAAASMIYLAHSGNAGGTSCTGSSINVVDTGADSGTSYAVGIHCNANNGLKVETGAAGKVPFTVENATNATAAAVLIDGDANGWLGAANVGMVHLTNDIALGHADCSMLLIDKSAAIAEVNDARGTCLRIVENMNVTASAPAYAAYISSTNNEALLIDAGELHVDEEIHVNLASAGAGLGHIKIGTSADHGGAAGENVLTIKEGAAVPAGALANCSSFFCEAGEMDVIDSGGVETTLSPHTADGDYVINSYVPDKGSTLRIHLEKLVDFIVTQYPEAKKYVERITGRHMTPRKDTMTTGIKVRSKSKTKA